MEIEKIRKAIAEVLNQEFSGYQEKLNSWNLKLNQLSQEVRKSIVELDEKLEKYEMIEDYEKNIEIISKMLKEEEKKNKEKDKIILAYHRKSKKKK